MGSTRTPPLVLAAGLAAAIAAAALAPPAAAAGAEQARTGAQAAALVHAATPSDMGQHDVAARPSTGETFAATGGVVVDIPATADGAVTATSATTGAAVSVQVSAAAPAAGTLAPDGSVVYDQAGSTDATVQPTDDGFRIHTLIHDADAPTRYAHQVTIPPGAHLALIDDLAPQGGSSRPGGALILDADGHLVAGFAPPWAIDATGRAVPTHYEITGNALVQVVEHHAGAAYPVVADPYLGLDLVSSARWINRGGGATLSVTPTGWARANFGSYLVGTLGWNELYAKYRGGGLDTNLDAMRDQYICHQQVAAFKAQWNLDQWRRDLSYPATVAWGCNP